jgi:uncharacterized protein YgiM (DUF1202 family)
MRRTTLLAGLILFARLASAEILYVKTPNTELKSSTAANATVLAKLPAGAAVNVTSKQGSWVQGNVAGKSGWIYKFKLSTSKPSSGGNLLAGLGGGGASAREGSTAASIRGLSPTSEKYAGRVNIGPQHVGMVKHMESMKVSPAEVERFLKEGKLGEFGGTP